MPIVAILFASTSCEAPPPPPIAPAPIATVTSELRVPDKFKKYVPAELQTILDAASDVADLYSYATAAVPVAEFVAKLLGFVDGDPDMREEFDKLHTHLNAIATAITWQAAQEASDDRRGTMSTAIRFANDALTSTPPRVLETSIDFEASRAAELVSFDLPFKRYFTPEATAGDWKEVIPEPPVENGFVYDWREGLPALMLLSSLRLQVMKAAHPMFPVDAFSQNELGLMRDRLWDQYGRILVGVQCGQKQFSTTRGGAFDQKKPTLSTHVACADIHTGIAESAVIAIDGFDYDPTDCPCYRGGFCSQQNLPACIAQKAENLRLYNVSIDNFRGQAFAHVTAALPFNEIAALANKIENIRNPAITVVSATYGGNCGARAGNVTAALSASCDGLAQCTYSVRWEVLGDPAWGCAKDFVAQYSCAGDPTPRTAFAPPEAGWGSQVALSCR